MAREVIVTLEEGAYILDFRITHIIGYKE